MQEMQTNFVSYVLCGNVLHNISIGHLTTLPQDAQWSLSLSLSLSHTHTHTHTHTHHHHHHYHHHHSSLACNIKAFPGLPWNYSMQTAEDTENESRPEINWPYCGKTNYTNVLITDNSWMTLQKGEASLDMTITISRKPCCLTAINPLFTGLSIAVPLPSEFQSLRMGRTWEILVQNFLHFKTSRDGRCCVFAWAPC